MAAAGLVDVQSFTGIDTVGADSRGYDAGKKATGRKRRIVTCTQAQACAHRRRGRETELSSSLSRSCGD